MPTIAAIDVGSNAIRLLIARVNEDGSPQPLENLRESVRLGADVFQKGVIAPETIERALEAFLKFRRLLDEHQVVYTKAVATSALREAANRDEVIGRIAQETGIQIGIIGGAEEARLIHLAMADVVNLKGKLAVLVDIGGGSTEITLSFNGQVVAVDSLNVGTVRLLQRLRDLLETEDDRRSEQRLLRELVQIYANRVRILLKKVTGEHPVDLFAGTGGNVESLGNLRRDLLGAEDNEAVTRKELAAVMKALQGMSVEQRIVRLGLRPDRADVIVPACAILQMVMKQAGAEQLLIPHIGLKEGVLLDVAQSLHDGKNESASRLGLPVA